MLPVHGLLVGAALWITAADRVPVFDIKPGCHAASTLMDLAPDREQRCYEDEASARAEVAKQWARFPAGDRQRCTAEAQLDGTPSYVDLLECLTLAREAKDEN
ncbi:hypothetical protein OPKNFCMD_1989 [Methylobacterium crusticola]|uniref:Uncharacterized protein n=1 Tax=Methylobacterium crusticola TaxID=1697972 RepID=A0ABQ4QVM2_9HYPH|nr:hypothetical protein [Methylobacterium crusticola]GJD49259.1 hypothetical protein OPKNFCMD_1989 [Methylobacterium crusticola]